MYNHYIPNADGSYMRHCVPSAAPQSAEQPCCNPEANAEPQKSSAGTAEICPGKANFNLEIGDILVLCILVLILMESEEKDWIATLITIAAFILLQ